jgi:hypothetical protein
MFRDNRIFRFRVALAPVALMLAAMLAGCGSIGLDSGPQTTSSVGGGAPSFRERMVNLFSSPTAQAIEEQQAAISRRDPESECPGVEIRPGAATLQFSEAGAEASALTLRYQASIARTARECAISAGTMTMKVGVQGRVILGPAGGPGEVNIPLRYALVREGVEPKTIWTNLRKFPVAVPANDTNLTFVDVEEGITFPLPGRNELSAYVVYVGFDQVAAQEKPAKQRRRRSR